MVRAKIYGTIVMLVLAALVVSACSTVTANAVTQEESQRIAEDFVRNSPTFVFDGIEGTLVLKDTIPLVTPDGWQFIYEFESRHAGYGDRTGQVLAQVRTPHRAAILVEDGEITLAVLDEWWRMDTQEIIPLNSCETL